MRFEKGKSGNPNGRPKTVYSSKLRSTVIGWCEDNALDFLKEIKEMKGNQKAQAFIALLNFAMPKLTEQNSTINLETLNDQDLDKLLERLTGTD
jgi:hypothetical protein